MIINCLEKAANIRPELLLRFAACSPIKNHPGLEIFRKIKETMFHACRNEQEIARAKRILVRAILKQPAPADDYINLVLQMGLLWIMPFGLIYFYRHCPVPEELQEGFIFVGMERAEGFVH